MNTELLPSAKGRLYLIEQYVNKKRSTYAIAEDLRTYANMIRRALLYHKIPLRGKDTAQAAAIEAGRTVQPSQRYRSPEKHREERKKKRVKTPLCKMPLNHFIASKFEKSNYATQVDFDLPLDLVTHKVHLLLYENAIAVLFDCDGIIVDDLIDANYVVIQVQQADKYDKEALFKQLLGIVRKVEDKFPPIEDRYIVLEPNGKKED